ncbi:HIT family protein [Nonomuraea aurantiaca]|uniref:HIT family protein n=1 Tax=Nonomuraea aurantiaca TaxID=2878562 RepID=UPI001CD9C6D2|nr:HIT domain-containing protein [Nonomuraea aurantiaca]MCA2220296.1 HIT domain-containing protein [Nonomuraea aurantiaca]
MGGATSSPCVFCEIMAGRAEASMPYQDDLVVVIMDINPVAPGDALVIPRVHAVGLDDLDEETGVHMWRIGHRLAGALRRSGLRCEGVNIFLADGEAAFQQVFHVHLHVFPRYDGDGFRLHVVTSVRERDSLNQDASILRDAMNVPLVDERFADHGARHHDKWPPGRPALVDQQHRAMVERLEQRAEEGEPIRSFLSQASRAGLSRSAESRLDDPHYRDAVARIDGWSRPRA